MPDALPPDPPAAVAPAPAATSKPVGIALAAQPPAATAIHTPVDGLVAGWSMVEVGPAKLPLYYAKPIGDGPFPVVLVVQEIFGVHEHITDVVRRFAKLGYIAVAPELYFRQGDPKLAPDMDALRRDFVAKADDAVVLSDLDRAMKWAATQGGDLNRFGLTGFCWGGRIAWLYAAHQPKLKAAVAWYGKLGGDKTALNPEHPLDVVGQLKAPVLGLYGGQDQGIPQTAVEAQRAALKAAGSPSEIVVYPEAGHAFFADYRPSYREVAAKDGWERMRGWLESHGVK